MVSQAAAGRNLRVVDPRKYPRKYPKYHVRQWATFSRMEQYVFEIPSEIKPPLSGSNTNCSEF